jgi:poly(A) polymerase
MTELQNSSSRELVRKLIELLTQISHDARPYLVGGAVRDLLLGRPIKDLDISVERDGAPLGRRLADALHGHFFFLREEDETARVLLPEDGGGLQIDITVRRSDISKELRERDFTVNAMALDLQSLASLESWEPKALEPLLIDPCGGLQDLRSGLLRTPKDDAFRRDPVRILRAIRLSASLGFAVPPETALQMRTALPGILASPPERIRDELMQILDRPDAAHWIERADELGIIRFILPDIDALHDVEQNYYHHLNAWEHTIEAVRKLSELVDGEWLPEHLRNRVIEHLCRPVNRLYTHAAVLRLAIIYHDVGKSVTKTVDETGRIRFFGHDTEGVRMANSACQRLRLSSAETSLILTGVRHHMRLNLMLNAAKDGPPSPKAILRFFLNTKKYAADVLLIAMADSLASCGPAVPHGWHKRFIEFCADLLHRTFYEPNSLIPEPLLNGEELMKNLGLEEGPMIGKLLRAIQEAQVEGRVKSREEALEFAKNLLENQNA